MRTAYHWIGCVLLAVVLSALPMASGAPILPDFDAATFAADSSISDNLYFPLMPGTVYTYVGQEVGNGVTNSTAFS